MANYETGYFTDITKTGIEAASISDNAVATYYDVQGRRLDAPQKGYKHHEARWQNNESAREVKT